MIGLGESSEEWIKADGDDGRRLIDDQEDWVRRELAHFLDGEKTLIPVLIDGAKLPEKKQLPAAIAALAEQQAFELRRKSWNPDFSKITYVVETKVRLRPPLKTSITRSDVLILHGNAPQSVRDARRVQDVCKRRGLTAELRPCDAGYDNPQDIKQDVLLSAKVTAVVVNSAFPEGWSSVLIRRLKPACEPGQMVFIRFEETELSDLSEPGDELALFEINSDEEIDRALEELFIERTDAQRRPV